MPKVFNYYHRSLLYGTNRDMLKNSLLPLISMISSYNANENIDYWEGIIL